MGEKAREGDKQRKTWEENDSSERGSERDRQITGERETERNRDREYE